MRDAEINFSFDKTKILTEYKNTLRRVIGRRYYVYFLLKKLLFPTVIRVMYRTTGTSLNWIYELVNFLSEGPRSLRGGTIFFLFFFAFPK